MKDYCRIYFKVYGKLYIQEFLSNINIKLDKIIKNKDESIELHFGYNENYNGDLEPMYYDTIKSLIPYTDILIKLREKGALYKLMVETNRKLCSCKI